MRVVLNDGFRMCANKLIIGAMYVLLVVGVMLNYTFTIPVMHWETFYRLIMDNELMMMVMSDKVIWVIASHWMVHVAMCNFCFSFSALQLFRVLDVHAKKIADMSGSFVRVEV